MDVQIKTLPDTHVAYLRYIGPYGGSGIAAAWQRFAGWCAEEGLMQPRRQMYGVCLDDPTITPPEKCRYDAAVEVAADFVPRGEIGTETGPCWELVALRAASAPCRLHRPATDPELLFNFSGRCPRKLRSATSMSRYLRASTRED